MQIPNSQLQPMQQNSAQQIAQQQYLTQENLAKQMQTNDQTSLSSSPWTDNHAQMFTQLMSQPGLPDNIRQSLMDAQNHFTSASTTPAAGRPAAASPVRANSDHFNAPGKGHVPPHGLDNNPKQTATAPEPKPPEAGNEQPFKGRTTSMQRRGRGVGQPTVPNPEPLTPALAAKAQLSAGKQPAPRVA
jgi:hypothetical protein